MVLHVPVRLGLDALWGAILRGRWRAAVCVYLRAQLWLGVGRGAGDFMRDSTAGSVRDSTVGSTKASTAGRLRGGRARSMAGRGHSTAVVVSTVVAASTAAVADTAAVGTAAVADTTERPRQSAFG